MALNAARALTNLSGRAGRQADALHGVSHAPGGAGRAAASAFLLRIDCEHTEALRYAGAEEIEARGQQRLLSLLRDLDMRATFAFVGVTAARFPDLAQAAADQGHAIAGHSNRHSRAYAGQQEAWQWRDMRAMIAAIQESCGVRVRGLAAPCHGTIDVATLRAAAAAGLEYVVNTTILAEGNSAFGAAPGLAVPVLVPPEGMHVLWDWTALQPGWPPFTRTEAQQQWATAIDTAAGEKGLVSLIVHPWIAEMNQEYDALADVIGHARSAGMVCATFDDLVPARGGAEWPWPSLAPGVNVAATPAGTSHDRGGT